MLPNNKVSPLKHIDWDCRIYLRVKHLGGLEKYLLPNNKVSPLEDIDEESENSSNSDEEDDEAKRPHCSAVKR